MADHYHVSESPSSTLNNPALPTRARPSIIPDHGISINLDAGTPVQQDAPHPLPIRHMSAPAFQSPVRHHKRAPSRSKGVKETLNARSHYGSSDDDGGAIHRINQYIIKQEIGRGSFGAVHLAVDQYGNEFAVKEFSKSRLRKRAQSNLLRNPKLARKPQNLSAGLSFNSPLHRLSSSDKLNGENNNSLELIKEEIAIMKKLDHHNLVTLIEVLDDPQEDSLYMVLEMCKKGVVMHVGLDERATPYDEEACRCWFRDMILGIEYLHAQGIIHRDIKPDNCLITHDDVLKIVDFGVSEMFEKDSDMSTAKSAGSPAFMPPELCVVRHGAVSGKAADIWSMGVTLYCLRYGRIPFEKSGVLELYESIKTEEVPLEEERDPRFADLMRRLLEKDPEKRITMDELREHTWVTSDGTDELLSAEENCTHFITPPTDEERDQAITGNMSQLLVVMKAAKRFKRLLKGPQFMDGLFGRESRIVAPPHTVHGPSKSADVMSRRPLHGAVANQAEVVDRKVDEDILQADMGKFKSPSPPSLSQSTSGADASRDDSRGGMKRRRETEHESVHPAVSDSDDPEPNAMPTRSKTFPIDEHAKGQAHDPLEDNVYLRIGTGADIADSDDPSLDHVISESPGGVDDDIYEAAYQEEIKRILAERENSNLVLVRRVEHIEWLRNHPNMLASSVNHAINFANFANSSARRAEARIREGGFTALVRDARDKARATVAEAERSSQLPGLSSSPSAHTSPDASQVELDGAAESNKKVPERDQSSSEVYRLRDYAKASASQALKQMSKRLDETAARLDERAKGRPNS